MPNVHRGIATPCFADDPEELIELGVSAEAAGFDGFFIWDHIVYTNTRDGPAIIDPWLVLAVVASRTRTIRLGTAVTPLSRRRPWVLARQSASLDILSRGRFILGVGLGSPAEGDFGTFGEVTDDAVRSHLLDEGLDIVAGLWSGELFDYSGRHFDIKPVRFTPTPIQRPRIPVWVGGVLPHRRPMLRAARWDGAIPIRYVDRMLDRPTPEQMREVRDLVLATRGSLDNYDLPVWAEVAADPAALPSVLSDYAAAGATWWIETARPGPDWLQQLRERIARGI